MSGALQAVFQNQRSFGPPAIGAAFGGGFFAGQISTAGNGTADYNLVVGPKSSAQTTNKLFKTSNSDSPGTSSVIDGPSNSAAMNDASHPAAFFCEAVTSGGFTDWYLPAKNELEILYYNLKYSTTSNNTSSGTNTNAVPSRGSNYTAGTPAQTTVVDFQSGGTEAFEAGYWSSTQASASNGWIQDLNNGTQYNYGKSQVSNRVRAVRRVAV